MDKLAIRIKELRLKSNMLQSELGNKLSVSKQTVSHWEQGSRLPSVIVLCQLANIFNVTTDYLLGRE